MTAVDKYERLECMGLWRNSAAAQLREVVVALRDATLILSDPRSGMALTHWSLPSIERLNTGEVPALFTAGRLDDGTPAEVLELDDADMIAAIDTVHVAIIRRRPHPGRLRGVMVVSVLTLVACLGVLWLPGAMIRHTASVLPESTRVQIGKMALQDMVRLTGSPCDADLGRRALGTLALHLSNEGVAEIDVVRDGVAVTRGLPGGLVLVNRKLVETVEDPEVMAGYVLAESVRSQTEDPVIAVLRHAGLLATLKLLTTGSLAPEAVALYAESLLKQPQSRPDDERLLERFAQAKLSSTAYARAVDPSGETTLALIEADPFKGKSPTAILDDNDWVGLQDICAG
ncbi:MAG: hypothetical protein H7245_02585 [Candidatus Saccharibacteria bacterium]|nr:hypothetical protein [Pseudorhodobacter sp.]